MDRVFCVSLGKEISALDAERYYRQGIISKNDFACRDENCRAEYTFVNIDNKKPKVLPYFRTAKNTSRPHIKGCKHDIEEKKVLIVSSDKPKQSRGALPDKTNYIFNTKRPARFFTRYIETPISPLHLDQTAFIRTINSTNTAHPPLKATNNNIYSIEDLLKKIPSKGQELFINGRTTSLSSLLRVVDNNLPEKKDGLIYCGLGEVISSSQGSLKLKFCRSFKIGSQIYDLLIDIDRALFSIEQNKFFYYRQTLEKTNIELAKISKSKNKTGFIYVYGTPKKIKGTRSFVINATSLDMCLLESSCSNKHLFARHIYDIEENKHLLSRS